MDLPTPRDKSLDILVLFHWRTLPKTGLEKPHFDPLISLDPAENSYVDRLPFLKLKMIEYWLLHKVQLSIDLLVHFLVCDLSSNI